MNKASFIIILLTLGIGVPTWCSGGEGDAMSGMASSGIVRLPHSGMVEDTFSRMYGKSPNSRLYRKSYKTLPRIDAKSRQTPSSDQNLQTIEGTLIQKVGNTYLIDTPTRDEPVRLLVDHNTIFKTGSKILGDSIKAQFDVELGHAKILW